MTNVFQTFKIYKSKVSTKLKLVQTSGMKKIVILISCQPLRLDHRVELEIDLVVPCQSLRWDHRIELG